jgi:hypothetical protein
MRSTSMNDAMHPSVLQNSTNIASNVQKTSSQGSSASNKSSITVNNSNQYQNQPRQPQSDAPAVVQNTNEKEVDYYNNPTELFRWINYRRWDGARARVNTNPEESSIWVVSRHSTDGRTLWRQLPIHLVCMQSGIKLILENNEKRDTSETSQRSSDTNKSDPNAHLKQVEDLVEELLEAYPDCTRQQDDQGMLPLHSCLNAVNASTAPNEKVLFLLTLANATALQVRDVYGRTPIDILKEKDLRMPSVQKALCLLMRAQSMGQQIKEAMIDETNKALCKVEQKTDNERLASQRIIHRLEQELADEKKTSQRELSSAGEVRQTYNILREELRMVKQDYATADLDLEQARKERDDLVGKTEILRKELDKQEDFVSEVKREAEKKIDDNKKIVASLRSEASTARAMAHGMESQLRSKFSNAEEMRNAVTQVRKEMSNLSSEAKREKKMLLADIERLEDEMSHDKAYASELEQKYGRLEGTNSELDAHLGQLLVLYNNLSSEYDQLFDSTSRHESSMMESIRKERSNLAMSLEKEKKLLEASIAEQEQILTMASKKESEIIDQFSRTKKRELEAVGNIKECFQEMRTKLSAKHCIMTEPIEKDDNPYSIYEGETNSKILRSSEPRNSGSLEESKGNLATENIGSNTATVQSHHKQKLVSIETSAPPHRRERKSPALITIESQPAAVELQKAHTGSSLNSPGLLSLLEQRAQYSNRRHSPQEKRDAFGSTVATHSSPEPSFQPAISSIKHPSYNVRENSSSKEMASSYRSSSGQNIAGGDTFEPTPNRGIPSPVMAYSKGKLYSSRPANENKMMNQSSMFPYTADDDDSATDRYTTSSQKSFSLDEYSDVDSKITYSGLSSYGTTQKQQYHGMRSAMKQDLIRVGSEDSSFDVR